MDSEDKKVFREILELSKDNNRILRGMKRAAFWSSLFRVFYWTLIIGSMVGAYYFIQPMLNQLLAIYTDLLSGVENVKQIGKNIPSGLVSPGGGSSLSPELVKQFKSALEKR